MIAVSRSYDYDDASRVIALVNKINGVSTEPFTYSYDAVGNIIQKTDRSGTKNYVYDQLYRLVQVVESGEQYNFDPLGNRLSDQIYEYVKNANNQITSRSDGSTFSYDDNGNMTNRVQPDSAWDYTWNSANQLVDATASSGESVQFEYDAFGRRISMTDSSSTTEFVYNGQDILLEYDNDVLSKRYTHGSLIDEHLVMTDMVSGDNYFYHVDLLGSTLALSDESGNIVERYTYSTYGSPTITDSHDEVINESLVGNRFLFTGRDYDTLTDLYYHRARYRDAELGIWLSKDPAGFVDGLNLYQYVQSNPIKFADPSGFLSFYYYGNYGGPGWTNGGWDPGSATHSTRVGPSAGGPMPIDQTDTCFMYHDICHKKCDEMYPNCPEKRRKCKRKCDSEVQKCLQKARENPNMSNSERNANKNAEIAFYFTNWF